MIILGRHRLEARALTHQVEVQGAIGTEAIALLDNIGPFDFAGIGQFTGDGFQNIRHAQYAHEVAEFVDHESDVSGLLAHLLQGIEDRKTVQQVDRPTRQVFQVRLVARQVLLE